MFSRLVLASFRLRRDRVLVCRTYREVHISRCLCFFAAHYLPQTRRSVCLAWDVLLVWLYRPLPPWTAVVLVDGQLSALGVMVLAFFRTVRACLISRALSLPFVFVCCSSRFLFQLCARMSGFLRDVLLHTPVVDIISSLFCTSSRWASASRQPLCTSTSRLHRCWHRRPSPLSLGMMNVAPPSPSCRSEVRRIYVGVVQPCQQSSPSGSVGERFVICNLLVFLGVALPPRYRCQLRVGSETW